MHTKVCKKCNEEKDLSNFYSQKCQKKNGETVIRYQPKCKECISKENKENSYERNIKAIEMRRKNPQPYRDAVKRYRAKNKETISKRHKNWRQNNPDKVKEYNEEYKTKQFKLSPTEWEACKEYFNNSCAYCGISEIESKEIHSKVLNKEHAFNDGNNDLSNCVPACTSCNSTKNINDYIDWYTPDNPVFSEERLKLIEEWLNEDHKKYLEIHIDK